MEATVTRDEVRECLPHGALTKIADEAGVSFATVSNWFRSLSDNIEVERIAMSKYQEIMRMRQELGYAPKMRKSA